CPAASPGAAAGAAATGAAALRTAHGRALAVAEGVGVAVAGDRVVRAGARSDRRAITVGRARHPATGLAALAQADAAADVAAGLAGDARGEVRAIALQP